MTPDMKLFNDLILVADEVTDFQYQTATVEGLVSALIQDGKASLARSIRSAAIQIGYWTWPKDAPTILEPESLAGRSGLSGK